jgi:uncharacterized protein YprB with RNaseH-like and TPR domain
MPSLSDKLKSLGVKVGANDLPPARPRNPYSIDRVLDGHLLETSQGQTYVVEARYPADYHHGEKPIQITSPLHVIAEWAGERRLRDFPPGSFAFLDTETTGLQGGSGTYAFLIGAGRFDGEEFHLAQFFMRDPAEEAAQLMALEEFLAQCDALVTFNGKAFDLPLLWSRYIVQGWRPPFTETAHVDLLHLARRLWRDRLPNRSLGSLEIEILGAPRSGEDVPGWMIPQMYFDYLRSGDARPLKNVFYHNAVDVVSMAALFNHMAGLLADPLGGQVDEGIDIVALAKLFESMGDLEEASRLYVHGLEHDLPEPNLIEAIQRLALIHKRQEDFPAAVALWEQAARHQHLEAHIELAKFYEHRLRDLEQALYWTESAVELVNQPGYPAYERSQWLAELEHRRQRLLRKRKGLNPDRDDIITSGSQQD